MTRTETPPEQRAAPPVPVPQAPAPAPGPPPTVLAWPAEWPVPVPPEPAPGRRLRAGRGLPMAPVLAAGGNATALAATGAYTVGGPYAVAATGAVVAAGATAAALRRRATVRRSMAGRVKSGGSGGAWRSGLGSGGVAPALGGGGKRRSGGLGSGGGGRSGSGSGVAGSATAPGASRQRGAGTGPGKTKSAGRGVTDGWATTTGTDRPTGPGKKTKDTGAARHKAPGPAATLKAAAGRAARDAAKSGSAPRRALAAAVRNTLGAGALPRRAMTAAGRGVGRGTKRAWTASASPRRRLGRATGRGLRRLGGASWDGLRAVLAAAWTGVRRRDRKAARARLREAWEIRRAARAALKNTTAPVVPVIADSARRPTTTTTTPTPFGVTSMSGHHFVASAMEGARAAAHYDPPGMLQVGADFVGLEEALRLHAEAMRITVENADARWPLDPRIVEIMQQIHHLQLKAAEMASELGPAFEKLHDVDLNRLRNPRKGKTGEARWDASVNL